MCIRDLIRDFYWILTYCVILVVGVGIHFQDYMEKLSHWLLLIEFGYVIIIALLAIVSVWIGG